MDRPEPPHEEDAEEPRETDAGAGGVPRAPAPVIEPARYGRYVGLLALVILALITLNTLTTKPNGGSGIAVGQKLVPFAVPLALSGLEGDADVATHAHEGTAGNVPACQERGSKILNICELYEQGPVVLALFVDSSACTGVLGDLQRLQPSFPGVRFAAVAIKAHSGEVARLTRGRHLTYPVGFDRDGALAALYKVASCPQVSFAYPGGVVQSKALLHRESLAILRSRVRSLVAGARARGWQGPAG